MDLTPLLDALFTLMASVCLALLAYGAWLCASQHSSAQKGELPPIPPERVEQARRWVIDA
jgi:hypothetical protein